MIITLINTNVVKHPLEAKLPEMIYVIESHDIELRQIQLKEVQEENMQYIKEMIQTSDMVIYITTVDCEKTRQSLSEFFDAYHGSHPPMYVVLDSLDLLDVDTVNRFIDEFEAFSKKIKNTIIDVKYYNDAIRQFKEML